MKKQITIMVLSVLAVISTYAAIIVIPSDNMWRNILLVIFYLSLLTLIINLGVAAISYFNNIRKKKEKEKEDQNDSNKKKLETYERIGILNIYDDGKHGTDAGKLQISKAKKLKIMQTTGLGLIRNMAPDYIKILKNFKAEIQILLAKSDGDFLKEVGEIEGPDRYASLVSEISNVENLLKTCVLNARNDNDGNPIGKIFLGYYNTHFRSSLLICDDSWCWMTLIFPPKHAQHTVSFELGKSNEGALINDCINHFDKVWKILEKRNEIKCLNDMI